MIEKVTKKSGKEKELVSLYEYSDDFQTDLLKKGYLEAAFFSQHLGQRKLFLEDEIEWGNIGEIIKHILEINRLDEGIEPEKRKPIKLFVTSEGGETCSGFALIDVILNSKTPVYTFNLAYQYSMGFLIGLAGHKRYANPNAEFLMHDGNLQVSGTTGKTFNMVDFYKQSEARTKAYVVGHTKITEEEYTRRVREEWAMYAAEAKEKGVIDYIIGVDCDIDVML